MFDFRLACAGLGLAGLIACSPAPNVTAPVRAVKVMTVSESQLSHELSLAGEIRATVESRLGFRVAGKLIGRHVVLGQRVKAGQLLAELDGQDYRLSVDSATAAVSAAQTNLALATGDYQRYKELRDKGFISGAELDRRETALKSAQAQLTQAQAALSGQRNQYSYSQLRADKAGVVTALDAEVGQVLSPGMPVVRVAQDGGREVVFAVPEDQWQAVKTGQAVTVKRWGDQPSMTAKVTEVAASADPVTRTYIVKAALPDAAIPLGSTATVTLKTPQTSTHGLTLPTTAVRQEGGQSTVWVVDKTSMTVHARPVVLGGLYDNQFQVTQGLEPGMQVVVAGVHVLSEGQKITFFQTNGSQP